MIKKEKGITLVSLIVTIVVMIIISSITVNVSFKRFEINKYKKMVNDIDLLSGKVANYYAKYNGLPIKLNEDGDKILYTGELDFDKNVNDNENYYILDLSAMEGISLNYGKEGYEEPNESHDVYVINEKSHQIYYVKGIKVENAVYHSKTDIQKKQLEDTIPPSKPEIKVVSGTKNDSGIYTTNVQIEIIPGKDSISEIEKTTYSINGGEEIDISTLTNNILKINSGGTHEIKAKSYDVNNNTSEMVVTITRESKVIQTASTMGETLELSRTIEQNLNNYRIYGYRDKIENNKIPSEYQRLEYIESTGTQYIDTGVKPTNLTKVETEFMYNSLNTYVYGSRTSSSSGDAHSFIVASTNSVYPQFANQQTNVASKYSQVEVKYVLKHSQEGAYINGELIKAYTEATFQSQHSMYLFGLNQNGALETRKFKGRIYYFKIWENGNLIREYIPCYRKADGILGVYDIVNNAFYANYGTGEFVAGPEIGLGYLINDGNDINNGKYKVSIDVSNAQGESYTENIILDEKLYEGDYIDYKLQRLIKSDGTYKSITLPDLKMYEDYTKVQIKKRNVSSKVELEYTVYNIIAGYTLLEHIESTGTQYIDAGVKPTNLTKVETEFMYNSLNGYIYGSRTSGSSGDAHSFVVATNNSVYPQFANQQTNVASNYSQVGVRYVLKNSQEGAYINDELIKTYTAATFQSQHSIYLFALNQNGIVDPRIFSGKMYYFNIWDSDVLVRNFIPCKRNSDGVIGLYDNINKVFYTNAGTGEFIAGPVV